jgi:RNA polymerase-binding protein DksA
MERERRERLRERLLRSREDLNRRLERISANLRRGLDPDSAERAKQLEDSDVVDALGNEARLELIKIAATLRKMDSDEFGTCVSCGSQIGDARLEAYPYASECIDCARDDEAARSRL